MSVKYADIGLTPTIYDEARDASLLRFGASELSKNERIWYERAYELIMTRIRSATERHVEGYSLIHELRYVAEIAAEQAETLGKEERCTQ